MGALMDSTFTGNEVAGAFSRVFEGVFLTTSTRVQPDFVSMYEGDNANIIVCVENDEWVGRITDTDGTCLECYTHEGLLSYGDLIQWLYLARDIWDTEAKPVAADWHDKGGEPTSLTGDFSAGERWASRTIRTPLVVYGDDPEGWCVGFGRNPREAAASRIHGPWADMNHAKLFAEAWVALDNEWQFAGEGAFGNWTPKSLYSRVGHIPCDSMNWVVGGDRFDNPLLAIQSVEFRMAKTATQIGDPGRGCESRF